MPWLGGAHDKFLFILDDEVAMPTALLQSGHVLDPCGQGAPLAAAGGRLCPSG